VEGGSRLKYLQQGTKLPDDLLPSICRTIKLSPLQSAAFGFAVAQTQYRTLAADAVRFLRSKLPEINAANLVMGEVSNEILHMLIHFVTTTEVIECGLQQDLCTACLILP